MRVLLINPQTPRLIENREYYLPLSLLYLAGSLVAAGHEAKILDLNTLRMNDDDAAAPVYEKAVVDAVMSFAPGLIGLGCLFSGQFPSVRKYAQMLKRNNCPAEIVIGGIHPTIFCEDILKHCAEIDYVVLGEGERTLVMLAELIEKKEPGRLVSIDGIGYRDQQGVMVNKKTQFIQDPDTIPFPAYDLVRFQDYYLDTSKWHNPRRLPIDISLPVIFSRSCPMRCNFCSMFMVMGTAWRGRSPTNMVDEIEYLYRSHGRRHFSFMDDNLTLNKKHVLEVCRQIVQRRLVIQFETPNGISTGTLDEEVIDALVHAGLVRLSLAIESGSDFIRNTIMGKHLQRDKIYDVVRLVKQYPQLYVRAFFMMGMPEDTAQTLSETYTMIQKIDVDKPIVMNLLPFPGTKLFEQAVRDKLFFDDFDPEQAWSMDTLYFAGNKNFFIKPYAMTMDELADFRKRFDNLIDACVARKAKERSSCSVKN